MSATMVLLTWICVFVTLFAIVYSENDLCPDRLNKTSHLIHFHDHCYEFVLDHPVDWYHADADCVSKGGFLTDIQSYSEEGFLFNSMQYLGFGGDKGVWIGLTDEKNEGQWHWSNGQPVTFTNWAPNQPGLLGSFEDCGVLEEADHGAWHDYPCHGLFSVESHGWICKYAIAA